MSSINMNLVKQQLAPTGVLRAAVSLSNALLVTGKDANGNPEGVSPGIAAAVAEKIGVPLKIITYVGPGPLSDGIKEDAWDIGNIANETERAKTINFSPAYCNIEANYLVPAGSKITSISQVDVPGVRIACKARSAYDLWLTENIKNATIERTKTLDESCDAFREQGYEVLAGLKPRLVSEEAKMPGSRILPGSFTVIEQSIGCKHGIPEAAAFLSSFVGEVTQKGGLVETLILKHGVVGKLTVPGL